MSGSDEDVTRLIAVIERQRLELDRIHASAAGESVIAMARGALMERLGLSSAEAASQLAELSGATGVPLGEMAAAVLSAGATDEADEAAAAGSSAAAHPPRRGDWPGLAAGARCWPRPRPSWPPTGRSWPAHWPVRCWRRWTWPRS